MLDDWLETLLSDIRKQNTSTRIITIIIIYPLSIILPQSSIDHAFNYHHSYMSMHSVFDTKTSRWINRKIGNDEDEYKEDTKVTDKSNKKDDSKRQFNQETD